MTSRKHAHAHVRSTLHHARALSVLATIASGVAPAIAQTTQEPAWFSLWNGEANLYDHGRSICLLPDKSVAITGESWHTDGNWAMATSVFTPLGTLAWSSVYIGPFPGFHLDRGVDVQTDAAGHVYTLGTSSGGSRNQGGSDFDIVLIKHSPDGAILWTRRFNAPGNWSDIATALAVDTTGRAYISGSAFYQLSDRGFFATDFLVLGYSPEGDLDWTYHTTGPGNRGAIARDIALGPSGDVFATGQIAGAASGDQDFIIVRLDAHTGAPIYRTTYSTPGFNTTEDDGQHLAVDHLGQAHIVGQWMPEVTASSPNRHRDALTIKLSPVGQVLWTATTTRDREEQPFDIVVGTDGRVYVGGVWLNQLGNDGWIECYSPDGQTEWTYVRGEPDNFDEEGVIGLEIGSDGHLFACIPDEEPTPAGEEVGLVEFTPGGSVVSHRLYGAGSTTDHAWDFELAPDGSASFGGYSYRGTETDSDMLVLRVGGSSPSCPADLDDGSGTGTPDAGVTIDDLLYFLDRFGVGDLAADLDDGSGTGSPDAGVTIDDLLYFLDRFNLGC
ncbi:MAG: GC-type dockerin domain-anchored protein [Phycisphaerales bacterium]